jgi:tRNA threonylcarbamoyladenosine biosynthesis protein TsaE
VPLGLVAAYGLGSGGVVDDTPLDADVTESVTVVEWGEGLVEGLADDRVVVSIRRSANDADETRTVTVTTIGERADVLDQ